MKTYYTAGTKTKAEQSGTYTVVSYDYWGNASVKQKYLHKNDEYTPAIKNFGVDYNRRYYETVCDSSIISSMYGNKITQIDAVLYNNHSICGKVGACSFNGALVCRNEAIQYTDGLYMNWDIRLYSGSSETVSNDKVGLAKSSDNPPQVIDWRELAEGVVTFD